MNFTQLYIHSSLHVALAVTAFSVITFLEFNEPVSVPLLLFTFSGTVVSYNVIKYVSFLPESGMSFYTGTKSILVITFTCLFILTGTLFMLNLSLLAASALLGSISLAYAAPVLNGSKNLRQIYGIKIFMIGFVWAGVTVLLPLLHANPVLVSRPEFYTTFLQRLLYVIALTIPFDIRDRPYDPETLGTIPMILGNRNAGLLGIVLLGAVTFIEFGLRTDLNTTMPVFIFIMAATTLLLIRSIGRQSPLLASFWIEGIPILWALLLLFFSQQFQ